MGILNTLNVHLFDKIIDKVLILFLLYLYSNITNFRISLFYLYLLATNGFSDL
jgi:hypothetical protein